MSIQRVGDHIEELELQEPGSSCWISCCLATGSQSGRPQANEDWNRALSLIPIKDKDTQKLFRMRMRARRAPRLARAAAAARRARARARREGLRKDGTIESEDSKGRTLLWHSAYYNDSTASIIIIKMLPHTTLILEPDGIYNKSPLQLAQMHRNSDCYDVFKQSARRRFSSERPRSIQGARRYVRQKDLDAHWHHSKLKDNLLV